MNIEKDTQKRKNNKKKQDIGMWIVYGFSIGAIVGLIFGDLVTGMLLGIAAAVIGLGATSLTRFGLLRFVPATDNMLYYPDWKEQSREKNTQTSLRHSPIGGQPVPASCGRFSNKQHWSATGVSCTRNPE